SADASALQPITIGSQICRDAKLWGKMAELVHGANDDAAFACNPRLDAKRRAEHAANAANEFLTCRLLERVVSQNGDAGRQNIAIWPRGCVSERGIPKQCIVAGFRLQSRRREKRYKQGELHVLGSHDGPAGRAIYQTRFIIPAWTDNKRNG